MVSDFFHQSGSPYYVDSDHRLLHTDHHRDATTSTDETLVPCTSSSRNAIVSNGWRDRSIDQCTQTEAQNFDVPPSSPPYMPQTTADSNVLLHAAISDHSLTDVNGRFASVNNDSLSAFSHGLVMQSNVDTAHSEDMQSVGLWKRFDNNAWHVEQEKLKQMSHDLPAELDAKDDQLPDLSSSNRLSVAALQLYDSFYGKQSASSTHRVSPARSLSSVWLREQNKHAARTAEQPTASVSLQKCEYGPCPAIHVAIAAEKEAKGHNTYIQNVCEDEVGNTQSSPSTCLSLSPVAQQT